MKLRTQTAITFTSRYHKGTYIKLEDGMDLHNGVYIVEAHDDFNLVMKNTKTGSQLVIKSTDDLSRYDLEAGVMKFVPNDSGKKETLKEPIKQPSKEECEKATDDFAETIRRKLEELYGTGVGVKFYGV